MNEKKTVVSKSQIKCTFDFFFIPYIHFPKDRIIKILKNISNFFACTDPRFKEIDIFKDYKR